MTVGRGEYWKGQAGLSTLSLPLSTLAVAELRPRQLQVLVQNARWSWWEVEG
jgi:hypothetical protein